MLREPQHERKIINVMKSPPFVLSPVEGLQEGFSVTCCGISFHHPALIGPWNEPNPQGGDV